MKKQHIILAILLAVLFIGANCTQKNPQLDRWPYCEYTTVKAYLYNLDNNLYSKHAVIKNNKLDKTVIGNGMLLNKKQVENLVETTNQNVAGLIMGLSKSYIPHHGIVFYNKKNKPVATITLCFDCEAIRVTPQPEYSKITRELSEKEIKKQLQLLEQYKKIIHQTGLPILKNPSQYTKIRMKALFSADDSYKN
ncbi:MAG: hypothetical protein GY757_16330 [bacterium]|nr:hypothetical protein [bacterium]